MGQSNSRTRPEDPLPASVASDSSSQTNTLADVTTPIPEPTATPKRSRRSSFRKNFLNFVKPRASASKSDSARTRADGSVSSTTHPFTQSSRGRWRSSRRLSNTPESLDLAPSDADTNAPSETVNSPSTPPPSASEKGKAKENDDELDAVPNAETAATSAISTSQDILDRPPTPFPSNNLVVDLSGGTSSDATTPNDRGLTREESEISHNIGSWLGGQGRGQESAASLANRLGLEARMDFTDDEVVIAPQSSEGSPNVAEPAATTAPVLQLDPTSSLTMPPTLPDLAEPTPNPAHPSRQFPPPGTLVVVQGVVHTTDVPRNPTPPDLPAPRSNMSLPHIDLQRRASSTPRPSTPAVGEGTTNNTRNRLSALIPRSRPTSMFSRPPPQEDGSRVVPESTRPDGDNPISDVATASTPTPTATERHEGPPSGPISSSSIDVLGTLLSVAAAATAASLLTGSSEPIFTSGLAPPSVNANMVNPAPQIPPSIAHPTIPPPASGIGALPFGLGAPLDTEPLSGQEQGGVRGRDRVRNAWGNLRERLGLRTNNTPANPSNEPNLLTRTRPDGTPMDAREVMLAEMARAFNLGLGLGADAAGHTNPSPPENESGDGASGEPGVTPQANSRSGRPLPPEDSFERFLINLQSELRVALSQPHLPPTQPPASEPEPTSAPTTPITMSAVPPVTEIISSELPSLGDVSDSDGEDESDDGDEGARSSMTTDSDMPPLLSNNPSHATFPSIHPPIFPSTAADTSEEPSHPAAPGSASGTEHRPGGSINWWRLYRFPPIFAPQAQGNSAVLNNTSSATPTMPGPDSIPDGAASTSSQEPSAQEPPHPPPPGAENRPNVVIPVIVVGLQSVNMNRRREQRTGEDADTFGVGDTNVVDNSLPDDVDFDGFPHLPENENTNTEPQQGRSWHSRAANAIRNLRPGRRGVSRETPPGEGPGSRTFLIYVIGGYYPPDHDIVTGANTLDSFEALWELAELLGQAKPPTVSKEEIEKSGLEIVKPAVLEQYEKDGKVSSNCAEKCLICLDEYDPEDDVRLLHCRHAFHKNCVDKWLQTGRNNCPACRSRGVFTDGNPGNLGTQAPAVV